MNWLFGEGGPLRVRAILAYVVVGVYAYLATIGDISPEEVGKLTLVVLAFYYVTRAGSGKPPT